MNKKILHIAESSVFLERTYNLFESFYPNENVFLINSLIKQHGTYNYSEFKSIIEADYNSDAFNAVLQNASEKYYLCIFHNIGIPYKKNIAHELKGKVPIHGVCWGWEIYDNPHLKNFLFQAETLKLRNRIYPSNSNGIKHVLKQYIRRLLKPNILMNKHKDVFNLLDSYSTILKSENTFMKHYYRYKKPFFEFTYTAGLENDSNLKLKNGYSILIGNSASFENNHLDVLPYLQKIKHKIPKIVLPISYGNKKYANEIERRFHDYLGDKCLFFKEFMPLDEYNNILLDCGFVVMNSIRQMAMGNIYSSLYQGAKVFFNKKSMVYMELKSLGYIVYTLEDLESETDNLETEANIEKNRSLVIEHRSFSVAGKRILKIIQNYQAGSIL